MKNRRGRLFLGAFLASLLFIFIYASPSFAAEVIIDKPYSPALKWCKQHVKEAKKCRKRDFLFQLGNKSVGASFHVDSNWVGNKFFLNSGYGIRNLSGWDNKISSIKIGMCTNVEMFDYASYKGSSLIYPSQALVAQRQKKKQSIG